MRKVLELLNRTATLLEQIADIGVGGGSVVLRGSGPPVSGPGGTGAPDAIAGTRYYDDDFNPPVPYEQMAADATSPQWVGILTGDQT